MKNLIRTILRILGHKPKTTSTTTTTTRKPITTSTTSTTTRKPETTSTTSTTTVVPTTSTTSTTTQVPVPPIPLSSVRVGTGEYQTFLVNNRRLYGLGNNLALQGVNNRGEIGIPNLCVQEFGPMPDFIDCDGGLHDGFARCVNRYAWHMGQNDQNGLAGIGSVAPQPYTTKIEVDAYGNPFDDIEDMASFFLAAAGGWVAVKGNGTVWIWGNCSLGFRGNGTEGGIELRPAQILLPEGKKAVQVIAGSHITVRCSDGTAYSWGGGCNSYGNCLGYHCTGDDYKTPHKVDNVEEAIGIAGGTNWNWAWSKDKLWFCGWPKHSGTDSTSDSPWESFMDVTSRTPMTMPLRDMVTNSNCSHAIDSLGRLFGTGNSPQGEIGDGTTLDMSQREWSWNTSEGKIITIWKRIVEDRSDFIKCYGSMTYSFYSYFECENGQLYFCGKGKSGIAGNGEVSGDYIAGGIDSTHPNSWDKPTAIPVNPFTLTGKILTPSPFCILNPSTGPCVNYSIPPTILPIVSIGEDQNISTSSTIISGSATAAAGRTICRYVWTKISGAPVSVSELCAPSLSVDGLKTGIYIFRLTATDNLSSSASKDIKITIN